MKLKQPPDFATFLADLAQDGLNLHQLFAATDLIDSVPELVLPAWCRTLLLIGSTGPDLWQAMAPQFLARQHPVDEYAVDCVNRALQKMSNEEEWQILFPATSPNTDEPGDVGAVVSAQVPLQKLGALAGWHHPSPLGLGIHKTHGLWFAYRAVLALSMNATAPEQACNIDSEQRFSESPCLHCTETPCLSRCPADALTLGENPNLDACVNYRLATDSACASTCLARLACPIGVEFRYTNEQTAYFYKRSLSTAQRWIKKAD